MMRTMVKLRWLVLALWLAAIVGLMMSAPNMADLVREKGQISVPDSYASMNANKWIVEMSAKQSDASSGASTVLVFHSDNLLTESEIADIRHGVEELKQNKARLGINSITTHFDTADLASQMVAKDGKTVLVLVNVDIKGKKASKVSDALYKAIGDVKVAHYYTGNWLIQEDVVQSSEKGLQKTEWITVVFILAILFVVFRSAIAPFIPLLTVGISYVASQSIVSFLVKSFNFPLSNFTQIFMVAVMFGIGTDYCILLISRFKEELAHNGGDKIQATLDTYRTAGKTVLFSGVAVLVGFASIGLSTFSLYRSAVAVAVGVAVLLIALVTLVPFFMAVLGSAIFWPARGSLEHKPSRLWGVVGGFSLRRPLWALVLLAVIIVPFLSFYKGSISFNSLDEIGDKYNSVKAFNVISDSFGPGDSLPTTVVLKSDQPLDTSAGLAMIEQVSRELSRVDGVKTVRSATRPTGDAPADFQVSQQVDSLGNGLNQGADGIDQVAQGLSDASKALEGNASKLSGAASVANKLVSGTEAMKQGVVQLGDGLKAIEKGLRDGSAGAAQLSDGLKQAKSSADQLAKASQQLLDSYKQLDGGLGQVTQAYGDLAKQQQSLTQGLADLGQGLNGLAEKHPELKNDADFQKTQGALTQLQAGSAQIGAGLQQLNEKLSGINAGLALANAGLGQAADGQAKLTQGLQSLAAGVGDLQAGIAKAADGQSQIIGKLPGVTGGFDQLTSGQEKLGAGFAQLNDQLGQLTSGLNKSVDGLTQVTGGLKSAQDYIGELTSTPDKQMSGWFIPEQAIQNADFQKALNVYLSPDRKIVKFDVVFKGNPYAIDTLNKVDDLNAAVDRAIKGTDYAQAKHAVGGVTSMNNDLHHISSADYARTVILMLIGIGLILILRFRSIVIPIYLILSLLGTYFTSLAINELIFVRMLGHSGASWTVPFFGLVLLLALGVDYSIFLMDRFKEYRHLPLGEAILKAMRNMGTVILSAAVILGGTFAAMLPSGIMSLLQIATIVLSGLFLYAMVVLPLFIPVMVRTFGEANWWPFMGRTEASGDADGINSANARPLSDG